MLQKAIDYAINNLTDRVKQYYIEDILIGATFTLVKLSSGFCGVAKTEFTCSLCSNNNGLYVYPGKLKETAIINILLENSDFAFSDSLKLAIINALSAEHINEMPFNIVYDKDPIDIIQPENKKIVIVGAFRSYINKLSKEKCFLQVLELNENAFSPETKKYYVPATRSADVLNKADIVIITGSTIANKTIDKLLSEILSAEQIIVVGPTSGVFPSILFENNVSLIGSSIITDYQLVHALISEGASGHHLFKEGAMQKICIMTG